MAEVETFVRNYLGQVIARSARHSAEIRAALGSSSVVVGRPFALVVWDDRSGKRPGPGELLIYTFQFTSDGQLVPCVVADDFDPDTFGAIGLTLLLQIALGKIELFDAVRIGLRDGRLNWRGEPDVLRGFGMLTSLHGLEGVLRVAPEASVVPPGALGERTP